MTYDPIELPPLDDDVPEGDHLDGPTDEEAEAGHAMYLAIDDLDDHSNGIDQ